MAAIFQLNKSNLPQPSAGTKVLKAAEAAELKAAAEIITAAEQRAEKILDDAQKAYQTRYRAMPMVLKRASSKMQRK